MRTRFPLARFYGEGCRTLNFHGPVTPTQRRCHFVPARDRPRPKNVLRAIRRFRRPITSQPRKIFLDLSESRSPDRGIRRARKVFLDLSESSPAQSSTTSTRKIFLKLSGFWAIAGPLAGNRKMFVDLNGTGGSPSS